MYEYTILNEATWPTYAALADPAMPAFFGRTSLKRQAVGVGANFWGRPAGLIVAELDCAPGCAVVQDFSVAPAYQDTPVGIMLLQHIESILRERESVFLEFSYLVDEESASYERALAQAGWPTPIHMQNFYLTHREQETLSWLRSYRLPPGFEIFPWGEITAEECEQIKRRQNEQDWCPSEVSPFIMHMMERFDPACSIGLRHAGQVVGWIIGERMTPTMVYVAVAFISPELRQRTLGPAMIAEVSRRQWAAGVRTMALEARPGSSMARFAERAWAPFLVYRTERRGSCKHLIER
jgi:ribosomal protein S18 acetylase RimI-like enzyme